MLDHESIEVDILAFRSYFYANSQNLSIRQNKEFLINIEVEHLYNKYCQYFIVLQILEEYVLRVYYHSVYGVTYMSFISLNIDPLNFLGKVQHCAPLSLQHGLAEECLHTKR